VELVTGWVLGSGPCGQGCSKADIGQSTNQRRKTIETNLASTEVFGIYYISFKNPQTKLETSKYLRSQFENNYTETIIAVSKSAEYEQELLRFSFLLFPTNEKQEFE